MPDVTATRIIGSSLAQVRKALQRMDASDGNPTVTWNATKTEATDVSADGTISFKLARVAAKQTSLTVEMTANDPMLGQMLQLMGGPLLEQAIDEIVADIARDVQAGGVDL